MEVVPIVVKCLTYPSDVDQEGIVFIISFYELEFVWIFFEFGHFALDFFFR